jgi:tetratricopeptide (TPR) repeat protein
MRSDCKGTVVPQSVSPLPDEVQPLETSPEFVRRAARHLEQHDYAATVRVCRLGLLVKPTCLEGRLLLGLALLELERPHEALQEIRIALETDEASVLAHSLRGEALLHLGDLQHAHEALARARELDPNNKRVLELLAECELLLDRVESGTSSAAIEPTETSRLESYPPKREHEFASNRHTDDFDEHHALESLAGDSAEHLLDTRDDGHADDTVEQHDVSVLETHVAPRADEPTTAIRPNAATGDSDTANLGPLVEPTRPPRTTGEELPTATWMPPSPLHGLAEPFNVTHSDVYTHKLDTDDSEATASGAVEPAESAHASEWAGTEPTRECPPPSARAEFPLSRPRTAGEPTKRVHLDQIEGRNGIAQADAARAANTDGQHRPIIHYDPHASIIDTRPKGRAPIPRPQPATDRADDVDPSHRIGLGQDEHEARLREQKSRTPEDQSAHPRPAQPKDESQHDSHWGSHPVAGSAASQPTDDWDDSHHDSHWDSHPVAGSAASQPTDDWDDSHHDAHWGSQPAAGSAASQPTDDWDDSHHDAHWGSQPAGRTASQPTSAWDSHLADASAAATLDDPKDDFSASVEIEGAEPAEGAPPRREPWQLTGHGIAPDLLAPSPLRAESTADESGEAALEVPPQSIIESLADPLADGEHSEVSVSDVPTAHFATPERPREESGEKLRLPSLAEPEDGPRERTGEISASAIHILPDSMPPLPTDDEHGPVPSNADRPATPPLRHTASEDVDLDDDWERHAPKPEASLDSGEGAQLESAPIELASDPRAPVAESEPERPAVEHPHSLPPFPPEDSLVSSMAPEVPSAPRASGSAAALAEAPPIEEQQAEQSEGAYLPHLPPSRTAALTSGGDSAADSFSFANSSAALSGSGSVGRSADDSGWASDDSRSYDSAADESVLSAAPSQPGSAERPPRAKKANAPLRRRRRRALVGALEGLFDTRRGHGKVVLVAVCVGVIVLALGVGFTVRYLRVSNTAAKSLTYAHQLLRQGNYRDYLEAAEIFAAIGARTKQNLNAVLAHELTRALTRFEFGVDPEPAELSSEIETEHPIRSAIDIVEALDQGRLSDAANLAFNGRNLYPQSAILQYLQGRIELLHGKPALALGYFKRASQLQKGNALFLTAAGQAHMAVGAYRAAAKRFKSALAVNPKHVGALLAKARLAVLEERHEEALTTVDSILGGARTDDASPGQLGWAMLFKAQVQIQRGSIKDARSLLTDARRSAPVASPTFLDELARLQIDVYQLDQAADAATRAAKMMPGRPYPLLLKARVSLAQGRAQAAWDVLRSDLIPSDIGNKLRARTLLALSQTAAARQQLALLEGEGNLETQLLRAEILSAERNFGEAERIMRETLVSEPENRRVLTALARVLLHRGGAVGEARRLLERAIANDDGAVEAQLTLTDTMLAEGKYRAAHQHLIDVVRSHPWLTPGGLRLAELNFGRRDLAAAKRNLNAILRDNPNNQHAHLLLIRVLLAQREFASAEQRLLRLSGIAPGQKNLIEARVALSKGLFRRAIGELRSATQRLLNDPEPPALLARAYVLDGKVQEARRVVTAMRQRFDGTATYQLARGRLALAAAKHSSALRAFRQALALIKGAVRLPSEEAQVLLMIGRTYHEDERLRDALSYYHKAAKACQHCPEPRYRQGLALDELGQPNDAIAALKFAARLNPGMLQVYYELGKIYASHNKPRQAAKMYKEYLKRGPPKEFAEAVRKILDQLE